MLLYLRVLSLALLWSHGEGAVVVDSMKWMVDMTHTIEYSSPNPPWWPPYNFTRALRMNISDGVVAEGYVISMAEHSGTHIDAPRHFCPNGKSVDEIPLEQFSGPGVVIRRTTEAKNNPDYEVTLNDFMRWEGINGRIPDGAIVLLDFGWDQFWPNRTQIYNSETLAPGTVHHPGLNPDASRWLTRNRNVHAVGIDTPSIDYGQTNLFESHADLCQNGIIIIENLANLAKLPIVGSHVYIGAPKLGNGTGTPSRVFAVMEKSNSKAVYMSIFVILSSISFVILMCKF